MIIQASNLATIRFLPPELVTRVLEHLPRRDLHVASLVSRHFYRLACDAGLAIHRTIYFAPDHDYQRSLATFKEVVAYALENQHHVRPGVSLRLVCECPADKRLALTADFDIMLDVLTDSIPVLVGLEAYVPAFFCTALYDALWKPAPRLRRLGLGQRNDNSSPAVLPPEDFLGGSARRLHSVGLAFPTLPTDWTPPSAFQRVTCADILLFRATRPPRPISHIFPRLCSLYLDLYYYLRRCPHVQVDLSGLTLDHLALSHMTVLPPAPAIVGVDIRRIRIFEHISLRDFDDPFWHVNDASPTAPLWARFLEVESLTGHRTDLLAVRPTTGEWLRTASKHLVGVDTALHPLSWVPGAETRLVALMLGKNDVKPFLLRPIYLAALRDLCVDIRYDGHFSDAFSDLEGLTREHVQLCCPGLRAVTLVSFRGAVEVHAHKVALLGEMVQPAEHPRMVLNLSENVSFLQPAMTKRLKRVFPYIKAHAAVDAQALELADACSSRIETPFRVPFSVYSGL